MSRRGAGWRTGLACLALLGAALAAGCGDKPAGGVLGVEIVPGSVDGEVPKDGWSLRPERGSAIPIHATGRHGDRGPIFEGRAVEGRYALLGPEPWMVVGGPTLVPMQPDLPPVKVGVGLRYRVYLLPAGAAESDRVGKAVAKRMGAAMRGGDPVSFERLDGPDRTALKIQPDEWKGTLQVRACVGTTGFAYPMPLDLEFDGTPTVGQLQPGPTIPVDVYVFPPPPAGTSVGVDVLWEGLPAHQDATTDASGRASFPTFPQTGDRATVRIGDATWEPYFPDASRGELRLVRPKTPAGGGGVHRIHGFAMWPLADIHRQFTVQARPEDTDSYGLLAGGTAGPADNSLKSLMWNAPLSPGRWRLWISDGDVGAITEPLEVGAGAAAEMELKFERLSRVAVSIAGGVPRGRLLSLACRRVEDGHPVTAQGWVDRFVGNAEHEFMLPLGTYRIELSEGGSVRSSREVVLDAPSTHVRVRLEPR